MKNFAFLLIVFIVTLSCQFSNDKTDSTQAVEMSDMGSNANFLGFINAFQEKILGSSNDTLPRPKKNMAIKLRNVEPPIDIQDFFNCSEASNSSVYCITYLTQLSDKDEVDAFLVTIQEYAVRLRQDFSQLDDAAFMNNAEVAVQEFFGVKVNSKTGDSGAKEHSGLPCFKQYMSDLQLPGFIASFFTDCGNPDGDGCAAKAMVEFSWKMARSHEAYCSCLGQNYETGC